MEVEIGDANGPVRERIAHRPVPGQVCAKVVESEQGEQSKAKCFHFVARLQHQTRQQKGFVAEGQFSLAEERLRQHCTVRFVGGRAKG